MNESSMTLARDYEGENPLGWFMSEKLDGCRAYFDGRCFWTRGGNVINAPAWFTKGLPKAHLDGELWAGRGGLQAARKAAQYGGEHFTPAIRFMVFDLPGFTGTWPERMATVAALIRKAPHARTVAFSVVTDARQVFAELQRVHGKGGEGVMLRSPFAPPHYEEGRTRNLLKVKAAHPAMFTLEFPRVRPARVIQRMAM